MTTTTTTATATIIMDDDIQQKNLIQQATTRLRRLQLEEQLSDMMAGLVNIQTQSKCLYDQLSHAMSTTQRLLDFDIGQQHQQMELLEIQCKLYQKLMLHQGFPSTINSDHAMKIDTMNDNHDAASMSQHSSSSMIPSLFSNRSISSDTDGSSTTSISEFTDMDSEHNNADEICSTSGDLCATAASEPEKNPPMNDQQLDRYQRRLRVKYHRQRYQYRQQHMNKSDDQDSVLADLTMASTASVSLLPRQQMDIQQNTTALHPLDKMETSPPTPFLSLPPSPSSYSYSYPPSLPAYDNNMNVPFSYCGTRMIDNLDFSDDGSNIDSYQYGHQPILNGDTITNEFLDQMDAIVKELDDCDGCDESFFQDMAFLLDQPVQSLEKKLASPTKRHRLRDMGSRVLRSSSSGSTMNLSPESKHGLPSASTSSASPYIDHLCHSGWKWCRFLSVMSASYVVSLLKGPDDLLLD
ncbi:unnamed protein product [Absidia cylindrospora]